MKLVGNRVLLTKIEVENKSESGIITSQSPETFKKGVVVQTGPKSELNLAPGETAYYGRGTDVHIEGEDYVLVEEHEIVCVK